MKVFKLKSLVAGLSLALTCFSANAAIVKSADSSTSLESGLSTVSSVGAAANSFSDHLTLSNVGSPDLAGSLSGTSAGDVAFTAFDRVKSDLTSVLSNGTLTSAGPRLISGGVDGINSVSEYFIHAAGIAAGAAGYNGSLSLVSQVPEPEVYGMLLAGIGLVCFVTARRRFS